MVSKIVKLAAFKLVFERDSSIGNSKIENEEIRIQQVIRM